MTPLRAAAASALTAALMVGAAATPALGAVKIKSMHYDPGSTVLTNSNINREYVTIKNTGHKAVRLHGWKLVDLRKTTTGPNASYTFKTFRLRPGHSVRVHSGKGRNTHRDLYWGLSRMRWSNSGDSAYLHNRRGTTVSSCTYDPVTDPSPAAC
jgi:hypothetical protein